MDADTYAQQFTLSLNVGDAVRDRSIQTASGQVGISDLGVCKEKTRRQLMNITPTSVPAHLSAIVGTYIHAGVEQARKLTFPHLLTEQRVQVTLSNGCVVPGTADEVDPDEPSVTDLKTADGLEYVTRHGSTEQQKWQRALYYQGAHQAGLVPAQGTVRNVWIDRSGKNPHPHVEQEPFNPDYVEQATGWLDDVLYATAHGEEASKDKPLPWCLSFCEHVAECRAGMLAPGGQITDPEVIAAAKTAMEAREKKKYWTAMLEQAQAITLGHDGVADQISVRQVVCNKADGGTYIRQEYRQT